MKLEWYTFAGPKTDQRVVVCKRGKSRAVRIVYVGKSAWPEQVNVMLAHLFQQLPKELPA